MKVWGLLLAASALASPCLADPRPYRGAHPLDRDGHWHEVQDVHVHDDLPIGTEGFGNVDGVLVFLGDPVTYGYRGDVFTYRGAHPIPHMEGYCGISGEHRHVFAPEGNYRREDNGAYAYAGSMHGGVAMAVPGRVASDTYDTPPPPVRTSGGLPYYYGCPQQLVMGPRGPVAVPIPNCVPNLRVAPTPAPPRVAPPASTPPPFAGRYGTQWGPPPVLHREPVPGSQQSPQSSRH